GTTAERVVRYSRRPVLVAKVPSDQPYRRVVIAFNRSEAAQRALATALALAPSFTWFTPRRVPRQGEERRRQSACKSFWKTLPRKSSADHYTATRGLPSRFARARPFTPSRVRCRLLMPTSLQWERTAAADCRRRCSEVWRKSCWRSAHVMSWLPGLNGGSE